MALPRPDRRPPGWAACAGARGDDEPRVPHKPADNDDDFPPSVPMPQRMPVPHPAQEPVPQHGEGAAR